MRSHLSNIPRFLEWIIYGQIQNGFRGLRRFEMHFSTKKIQEKKMRNYDCREQTRVPNCFILSFFLLIYFSLPGCVCEQADPEEYDYDILCKMFDEDGKSVLRVSETFQFQTHSLR